MYNEKLFIDYALNQFKSQIPNLVLEPDASNIFTYKAKFLNSSFNEKPLELQLYLGNAYDEYIKTNDTSAVSTLIKVLKENYHRISQASNGAKVNFNLNKIYPVIRNGAIAQAHDDKIINKLIGSDVYLYLIEDSEDYILYITKDATKELNYSESDLIKASFDNLKSIGWTPPIFTDTVNVRDVKVSIYRSPKPFHGQFLSKNWTSKYLGEEFYISFPNKDTVIVMYSPSFSSITSVDVDSFKNYTSAVMQSIPGQLSSSVYHFKDYKLINI